MDNRIEQRVEKAVNLFKQGYNCSQAVFLAYSDLYKLEPELAANLSAAFGGGLGRQRHVCGAVSAASMLMGLSNPVSDPKDRVCKSENYQAVQDFCSEFKMECGSIICRELLGEQAGEQSVIPEERTPLYYKKRPCVELVALSARLIGQRLLK